MTAATHLLRWLCSLGAREPSPKAGECMAQLTLYPPDERRKHVRGEPTRRPNRGYHPRKQA